MHGRDPTPSLARARNRAHRLLEDLRSQDGTRVLEARQRLRGLQRLAAQAPLETLRRSVRLKHALAVVAAEYGHASWSALKHSMEADAPAFHAPALGGFLFPWFASREDGSAALRAQGGFLLPYGSQCFLCETQAVSELGLDPEDADWRRVGFDLVRPADAAAGERLAQARRRAIRARVAVPAPHRSQR